MRSLPSNAASQLGVFSRRQALDSGWSRSALLHASSTGQLQTLRRGAFVRADTLQGNGPDAQRRQLAAAAIGALLTTPAAVASHSAAAVLARLPVWRLPARPCLTVPPRHTGDADGIHLHRASLPADHLQPVASSGGRLWRTSAARTVIDLAREHGIEDAVVAADAALHQGILDAATLERCLRDCSRWPGIRRARALPDVVDGRSESPLESVSRHRMSAVGLPAPRLQVDIRDAAGFWLARVDFYWDEFGVVGEVDGLVKYRGAGDDDPLRSEKLRQEHLERTGLIVVRWGYADLRNFARVAARIREAFARGGRRTLDERRWAASPSDSAPG